MISDFDDSGLLMVRDVRKYIPDVYRIGIDLDMIDQLLKMYSDDNELKEKLELKNLMERYTPGNAYKRLRDLKTSCYGESRKTFYKNLELLLTIV